MIKGLNETKSQRSKIIILGVKTVQKSYQTTVDKKIVIIFHLTWGLSAHPLRSGLDYSFI